MKYDIIYTPRFLKECRKNNLYKNNKFHPKIAKAVKYLESGEKLPSGFRDHTLSKDKYNKEEFEKQIDGVVGQLREFHIDNNYVMVYKKYDANVYIVEALHAGKHKDILHNSIQIT